MKINPYDDLLPDEKALLEGREIGSDPTDEQTNDDEDSGHTPELNAEALAAVAAQAEAAAPAPLAAAAEGEAGDEEALAATPAPKGYDAGDPAQFQAKHDELSAKQEEALAKLMDGTIDPAAYSAINKEVTAELSRLTVQQTLHEANVQQERDRQTATLSALRADGLKQGIDYSDEGIAAMFDAKSRSLAAKPEMAGKSVSEVYTATHAAIAKMMGKAAPAPTAAAAPAAKPATPAAPAAPKPVIPPTLGQMPSAANVSLGQDMTDAIANMDPDDAEAAMAKMPAAQRQAMLRATMPATAPRGRRH